MARCRVGAGGVHDDAIHGQYRRSGARKGAILASLEGGNGTETFDFHGLKRTCTDLAQDNVRDAED
jgi:hypothetical protein